MNFGRDPSPPKNWITALGSCWEGWTTWQAIFKLQCNFICTGHSASQLLLCTSVCQCAHQVKHAAALSGLPQQHHKWFSVVHTSYTYYQMPNEGRRKLARSVSLLSGTDYEDLRLGGVFSHMPTAMSKKCYRTAFKIFSLTECQEMDDATDIYCCVLSVYFPVGIRQTSVGQIVFVVKISCSKPRGVFRPRQTRQLPRVVDLKGRLLSCQSY